MLLSVSIMTLTFIHPSLTLGVDLGQYHDLDLHSLTLACCSRSVSWPWPSFTLHWPWVLIWVSILTLTFIHPSLTLHVSLGQYHGLDLRSPLSDLACCSGSVSWPWPSFTDLACCSRWGSPSAWSPDCRAWWSAGGRSWPCAWPESRDSAAGRWRALRCWRWWSGRPSWPARARCDYNAAQTPAWTTPVTHRENRKT